jgi:hypothetical protein
MERPKTGKPRLYYTEKALFDAGRGNESLPGASLSLRSWEKEESGFGECMVGPEHRKPLRGGVCNNGVPTFGQDQWWWGYSLEIGHSFHDEGVGTGMTGRFGITPNKSN